MLRKLLDYIIYLITWFSKFQLLNYVRWVIQHFSDGRTDSVTCLVGKTAIVTGGNSGIGYATSVLLASRGCRVIIACRRNAEKEREAIISQTDNPNIIVKKLDLGKLSSVRAFADDIKKTEPKIDILINNAGIGAASECCTEDGMNTVMQVNCFSHIYLTYLLLDSLKAATSSRVVFVSSMLALLEKLQLDNLNTTKFEMSADNVSNFYSNSKLCNILAAQELAKRLNNTGIIVNCADPGIVTTPIFQHSYSVDMSAKWTVKASLETLQLLFATDMYMGAQSNLHLATSKKVESGGLYFRCKPFTKPKLLKNTKLCNKIWNEIENILDMRFDK